MESFKLLKNVLRCTMTSNSLNLQVNVFAAKRSYLRKIRRLCFCTFYNNNYAAMKVPLIHSASA